MNQTLNQYAIPESRHSPKRLSNRAKPSASQSNSQTYIIIGLFLLVILLLTPVLVNFFSKKATEPKIHEKVPEDNIYDYRLDMGKFKEETSLNEFVNEELHILLPNIELNGNYSIFLSADVSEKMMKLYHEESLNIFKNKIDEYEIHCSILKRKYEKGGISGQALLKEIEAYELCDPTLRELKYNVKTMIDEYNNIVLNKNNHDSTLSNFLIDIKKKENDLAKTKKKYDLERGLLEKNLSDVKFKNSEDKLKNEIDRLKKELDNVKLLLSEIPSKKQIKTDKLNELNLQLESLNKNINEWNKKQEELKDIAENVVDQSKELSSKEILDIFKSDYNSRIQKLQKLAQTILESVLYEKNEVYNHRKSTDQDKKSSKLTLDRIKNRYQFILQSILKVSYKIHTRLKNQAKSDEKAIKYQSIYSEIKDIETKIETAKLKIKDIVNQIKRVEDEIILLENSKIEKEGLLRKNEELIEEKEQILKEVIKKIEAIKSEIYVLVEAFQENEKNAKSQIKNLEVERLVYEEKKRSFSEQINKVFREFVEISTKLNKKTNDCKINGNLIDSMIKNFQSFYLELEKFEQKKKMIENEIRKMYESLENQANLPNHY